MRQKHKKILLAGTATTVAGVLGIGTLLTSHLTVQASPEMMPGIETIVEETSQEAPFRILEIVDDKKDAEMGWYVSGQEPYIKLYSYTDKDGQVMTFSTLEEGLAKLPTKELREQFARNITYEKDEKGEIIETPTFKDVSYASYTGANGTKEEDYPLSYTPYQEKYFLSNEDEEAQWNRIDFSEIRTVTVKGSYVENPAGTGNYTKEEQSYYPIREDNLDDAGQKLDTQGKEGLFRENIRNFLPSESPDGGGNAAYHLVFQAVENNSFNQNLKDLYDPEKKEQITQNPIWKAYNYSEKWDAKEEGNSSCYGYGYYENTYEALTARIMEDILPTAQDPEKLIKYTFPGENPSVTIETRKIPGLYVPESKLFGSGEISLPQDSSTDEIAPFDGIEAIPDGDLFGDGSFGDGSAAADDFSAMSFSSMPGANVINLSFEETTPVEPVQNFDQEDTQIFQPEQGIENPEGAFSQTPDTSAENEEISNTVNEVLGAIAEKETAGTQKNPYIYIAEELQAFPYYRYRKVGDLQFIKDTAVPYNKEHPYEPNPKSFLNISIDKNGQYLYWTPDEKHPGNWLSQELFIVTGRQPVAYEDLHSLPVDENNNSLLYGDYYYKVVESYFCCRKTVPAEGEELKPEHYQFYGWDHPSFPENEPRYLKVEKPEEATYYISDAKYTYTPGKGDYDFVPDENGEEHRVEVDHLFYRGGYQNHDWLKQYVFHLKQPTDESSQTVWDKFSIQVDTLEANAQTTFSDVNSSTDEFTDNTFSDGTEAAVIDSSARQAAISLEDYDLIYINGHLSPETANSIANANPFVPCIINQVRTAGDQSTIISEAFREYIKQEDQDQDQHYVSQQVYFFKNTWQQEPDGDSASLLNLQFFKNFNPDAEQNGTIIDNQQTEGFEEILEYIEKENQYRQIGSTDVSGANTTGFTDGTETAVLSDGTSKNRIPLLDKTLSQARAIEYILNYRHKRKDAPSGPIRILELEPGKWKKPLTAKEVLEWFGYGYTIKTCCYNQTSNNHDGSSDFMCDGNTGTWWHSSYKETDGSYHLNKSSQHTIIITMDRPNDYVSGIQYTPRTDTSQNGILKTYKLEAFDDNDQPLQKQSGEIDEQHKSEVQTLSFSTPLYGVKTIKLTFVSSFSDGGNKSYASCAELKVLFHNLQDIQIDTMTTSEFVGHIEDINTKYNMVYLGDDDSELDYLGYFRPNENVLYYHIGKEVNGYAELLGLMDHDYTVDSSGKRIGAALIGNKDPKTKTPIGTVRGSGNDITEYVKEKLVDFAKSGYPVVVAGQIYGENKTISTELVDNSSYIYDFLSEIRSFQNVYREEELSVDTIFYLNLPKPKIVFAEVNGTPPSVVGETDGSGPSKNYLTASSLTFQFEIQDEAQASPANATYDCELFLDLNCDGNFSKSEKMEDILIRENGKEILKGEEQTYQLSLNHSYTVSRTIPEEYIKLIPWKLVVTNNQRNEIRTSEIGYTKRKSSGTDMNTIQVLQITPNKDCTWNLNDADFQTLFDSIKEDFSVTIEQITVEEYEKKYKDDENYLDNYHMLIVGFGDGAAYGEKDSFYPGNFTENGVNGIMKFAKTGKSVILSHDNTSSSNYDREAGIDNPNSSKIWKGWAYYFNQVIRPLSGMDRYGITDPELSSILKKAQELSIDKTTMEWNSLLKAPFDVAYSLNGNKTQSYSETQGFTNAKLVSTTEGCPHPNNRLDNTSVSQVNQGAITEYPYKISNSFNVANTHPQYYQLALEEDSDNDGYGDVVVWYCLGTPNAQNPYYEHTPNDVRNNYYIYSYKNIIYTGVGHNKGMTEMERKLFVNTIIAAYNAQAVNPNLSFVSTQDMDAPEEDVVYYSLDHSSLEEELLFDRQDFFLKVTDNNLVGTSFGGSTMKDLKLELFIESDRGTHEEGIGDTNTKTEKLPLGIDKNIIQILNSAGIPVAPDTQGNIYVKSGNVYKFTLHNLQKYLLDENQDFKESVKLYAKVSCEYLYYGKPKTAQAIAQISINQRQLFDLD